MNLHDSHSLMNLHANRDSTINSSFECSHSLSQIRMHISIFATRIYVLQDRGYNLTHLNHYRKGSSAWETHWGALSIAISYHFTLFCSTDFKKTVLTSHRFVIFLNATLSQIKWELWSFLSQDFACWNRYLHPPSFGRVCWWSLGQVWETLQRPSLLQLVASKVSVAKME